VYAIAVTIDHTHYQTRLTVHFNSTGHQAYNKETRLLLEVLRYIDDGLSIKWVSEWIVNGTSVQLDYTVPYTLVYANAGKYRTEDKKTDKLLKLSTTQNRLDWIMQCFTSQRTQYRLYGRRFLQVKRPNWQYQSTEGTYSSQTNQTYNNQKNKHKQTTQNTAGQNKPDLVSSYDTRPWSGVDLSIKQNAVIAWLSMVLRLRQHNIGYTADGFYRSDDPTNSVKALKEGG